MYEFVVKIGVLGNEDWHKPRSPPASGYKYANVIYYH